MNESLVMASLCLPQKLDLSNSVLNIDHACE